MSMTMRRTRPSSSNQVSDCICSGIIDFGTPSMPCIPSSAALGSSVAE